MRLTLRTLLAYLDDVLPPEQAKEMGQKLTESGFATALVDRIKEVMRRRRLSAPELFTKAGGVEPNLVAEYLDNELNPNEVADVEKICLDSDIHLAEVAACHQILTLVLGEPVDVRAETRARMYALGPVAPSDMLASKSGASTMTFGSDYRPISVVAAMSSTPSNAPFESALPDYLRPKTSWKRVGLLAIVLLITVGWISLLMHDDTLSSNNRSGDDKSSNVATRAANDTAGTGLTKIEPAKDNQLAAKADITASPNESVPPKQNAKPNSAAKVLPDPDGIAEINVAANEADKPSTTPRSFKRTVPPTDDAEDLSPPKPTTRSNKNTAVAKPDAAPPITAPEVLPARKLVYQSKEGRLLHFEPAINDFVVLPLRTEVKPNDRLVSPEPFRADLVVGGDECLVALIGGTAVTCLPPTDKTSFGFDIAQGMLLFESKGLSGEPKPQVEAHAKSLAIAIVLRGQRHLLELASDDALCGLEVRRREPTHFETEPEAPGYSASLHVPRGIVRFTTAEGKISTVEGPGFLPLTADVAANVKASEIGRASQLIMPDWLEPDPKRAATKQKRLYNTPFEKEFDPEQPLSLSVPAIVNNPRPALAELAVKCLAVTDSYQPLVKTLVNTEHREARLAAIAGLRQWLPQDTRNRQLLKVDLARHLLPTDTDIVYRLLWGFNHADAKNPATSRQLVAWMEHEQVAVRELAFWHVQHLTGLKHDYSPINPAGQRRVAIERWHLHLEKKGGALVQE